MEPWFNKFIKKGEVETPPIQGLSINKSEYFFQYQR